MLKKIQADKERTNDIKQQDIFYITKYASRFHVDPKKLGMDWKWSNRHLRALSNKGEKADIKTEEENSRGHTETMDNLNNFFSEYPN